MVISDPCLHIKNNQTVHFQILSSKVGVQFVLIVFQIISDFYQSYWNILKAICLITDLHVTLLFETVISIVTTTVFKTKDFNLILFTSNIFHLQNNFYITEI